MASQHPLKFTRRANGDGTIDSICRNCFITVATAQREADLDRAEHTHHCDQALLEHYQSESASGS